MRSRTRTRLARVSTVSVAMLFLVATVGAVSFASHGLSSLSGSNFEIDSDANLAVDHASPSIDWENVTFAFQTDKLQGEGDNAFKGSAESDPCPEVDADSIPPNKSDLTGAGFYVEPGTGGDLGFLHLYWSRIQDPSGSTDMDFELNQQRTLCQFTKGNKTVTGGTPIRLPGDLLIEYHITSGGSQASIFIREWSGTAWGVAEEISLSDKGAGTINSSSIDATSVTTDEGTVSVGPFSPRTFGEASVSLDELFPSGTCRSFGSAYLKSRSSFSFTSALKDFVSPQPVEISNCGRIVVEKLDENDDPLDGAEFTVEPGQTTNGTTEASTVMDEVGTGLFCLDDLLLGVEYTVSETVTPDGYQTAADQTHTITEIGACAGVTAADADLTFVNLPAERDVALTKEDDDGNPLEGVGFTLFVDADEDGTLGADEEEDVDPPGEVFTDPDGVATFQDIVFGFYCVVETSPLAGYTPIASPICFELDGNSFGTFLINNGTAIVNEQEHKVIVIVCHEGTGTLAASDVEDEDANSTTTIDSSDVSDDEEEFLCGLDGYGGKPHGEEDYTVDVGSDAHN